MVQEGSIVFVLYSFFLSSFLSDNKTPLRIYPLLVRACPVSTSFTIFPVSYSWIPFLCSSLVYLNLARDSAKLLFADRGNSKWNTEIQGERQKSLLHLLTEVSAIRKQHMLV